MDTYFTLSACLTALLLGTLVSSEDRQGGGPSAEAIRRYLSLYEQRSQLDRLKSGGGFFGNGHFYLDPPVDEENVYDSSSPYDSVRGAPTRSQWSGTGQPEFPYNVGPFPNQDAAQDVTPQEEKIATGEEGRSSDAASGDQEKKSEQAGVTRTGKVSRPLPFTQDRVNVEEKPNPLGDVYFVVIVAGCSAAAIFGVIAAGYCFYRFQKNSKAAAEVDYPAYGVTGPNKDQTSPNGDRRLAQSAQMYHYQHQKQQMIAVEKATTARNTSASDIDSEEENEEGDYTVYECPGLAPTGEMEVKNPLFQDDSTPMSPPVVAKESKKP